MFCKEIFLKFKIFKIFLKSYKFNLFRINFIWLKKIKKKIVIIFIKFKKLFFIILKKNKKKKKIEKKSKIGRLKEVKLSLNIDNRDYFLKIKKTNEFLFEGYTVKVSILFKGREIFFKEKGVELILKFQNNIKGIHFKFSDIEFEGRTLYSVFIPKIKNENKKKKFKIFKKKVNNE